MINKNTILIYYEQYDYGGVDTHLAYLINYWPNKHLNLLFYQTMIIRLSFLTKE